jgi:hypothetical protein
VLADRYFMLGLGIFVCRVLATLFLLFLVVGKFAFALFLRHWGYISRRIQCFAIVVLAVFVLPALPDRQSEQLLVGVQHRIDRAGFVAEEIRRWILEEHLRGAFIQREPDGSNQVDITVSLPSAVQRLNPSQVQLFAGDGNCYTMRMHFGGQLSPRFGIDLTAECGATRDLAALGWFEIPQYRVEISDGVYFWHLLGE